VIICKATHQGTELSSFKNKVVAFNSEQSQSGYNSLRHLIAPLSSNGQFFQSTISTGGHKDSVLAVQSGQADIASIDGVTYEGFLQYAPEITQGLKIIATTHSYPGLPLISALNTPTALLTALKNSLQRLHQQECLQDTLKTLFIKKFSVSGWHDYEVCLNMEKQAQSFAYYRL
jgi:ABC-type phosphate/phosphonate transport system substrate-binding protein